MRVGVTKNVLRLNVTMANTFGMDVRNGPQKLVGIQLDNQRRHHLLHLQELLYNLVGRVGDVVHHNVQVQFVWLVAICVERLPHLDAVGVMQHLQDLKFSVFVPLVLEDFLDSHCFAGLSNRRFENDTEGTISDNFFSVVSEALLRCKKIPYLPA